MTATTTDTSARRRATMKRVLGTLAGILVLGGAAGIAAYATRDIKPKTAAPAHDHAAMTAATGTQQPVVITAAEAARIGVTYATVDTASLITEIRAVGQVTFDERRVSAVAPKIEGWVETLAVDFTGKAVAAGQPLLTLYSPMLVSAQEELLLARRLVGDVGAGTQDARRSADEMLESARRRLAYWDVSPFDVAEIERTGQVKRAVTIRTPVGGYVLDKNVIAGQRVMPGETLYRIADLRTVWIEGEVFEQDLAAVRLGQMVHADFQALPGEHHMGRITYVYPTLNPETRTARVRVELGNPGFRLKPGMYATLRVEGAQRPPMLTVPRSAVLVTGERSLVFVQMPDGRLGPRDVRLGVATPERVEILSGLTKGERVVSSATFLIDAESNLGSALRAMSVDTLKVQPPAPAGGPSMRGATPPAAPARAADPHAGHTMPRE